MFDKVILSYNVVFCAETLFSNKSNESRESAKYYCCNTF